MFKGIALFLVFLVLSSATAYAELTKEDLDEIRKIVRESEDRLRAEIKDNISSLRAELKDDIASVNKRIDDIRAELRGCLKSPIMVQQAEDFAPDVLP